ncbi:hypothetical protein QH294_2552 [Enterococcus faecalis]|nr:hypothetical protein QH294_2552 [Enterococcus faecalis]
MALRMMANHQKRDAPDKNPISPLQGKEDFIRTETVTLFM